MKKQLERSGYFLRRKFTLKARTLQFLTTFTQLTARLKNVLVGWLLVLGLEEGFVKCATELHGASDGIAMSNKSGLSTTSHSI